MSRKGQMDELRSTVTAFSECVAALDDDLFLAKVTSWTTRDIVAHLTGWNRYIIRGAEQILRGELPFYDLSPGPNYSRVNATLVVQYSETVRSALLADLAASADELLAFVGTLDPDTWDRDFGVRHEGETLTVKSAVDDLIADYRHHRLQLDNFADSSPHGRAACS